MKLVKEEKPIIKVGNAELGKDFIVIAGPCAIESEEQFMKTAEYVKEAGAHMLRGAVYKPRSSPYSFKGVRETDLAIFVLTFFTFTMSFSDAPMFFRVWPSILIMSGNFSSSSTGHTTAQLDLDPITSMVSPGLTLR